MIFNIISGIISQVINEDNSNSNNKGASVITVQINSSEV